MSFRTRLALIAAGAVAVAVLAASAGLYLATARTLRGSVDEALLELAAQEHHPHGEASVPGGPRPGPFGGAGGYVQVIDAEGSRLAPGPMGMHADGQPLPVGETARAVAAGTLPRAFETVTVGDEIVRVLTVAADDGLALQVARPLTEVEAVLRAVRGQLVLAGALGVALAAVLGLVVASRAVGPVRELTGLAEEVAATRDLTRRIGLDRRDELGRLAAAFDDMLGRLEQARNAQEQLVADASHELRTPLTSLRTNVEVLADADRLEAGERRRLIDDVVTQLDEFAGLVGSLVELARGARPVGTPVDVRLDQLVDRVARRSPLPAERLVLDLRATVVRGEPDRLERVVNNLLDNAAKHAPQGPVEVQVADGALVVRDHGPGVDPHDLPHVFDRFYRSADARGAPGSGLGLAIVRQVVESHGGSVTAGNADGGGAVFTVRLPVTATEPAVSDGPDATGSV